MNAKLHCLLLYVLVASLVQTLAAEPSKTNVRFIIVDDMTTTMSCQNWPGAKTPHHDALAARGVRFYRAYCQFAVGFIRPHTPSVAPQWAFDAIDRSQIKLPPFYTGAGEDVSKLPAHVLRPNNNVFRHDISIFGGAGNAIKV